MTLETQFLFPIPEDAAVSELTLLYDGKELPGKLLNKDDARRIYEEIVRRQCDPALLEYMGHGLFQTSVFRGMPEMSGKSLLMEVEKPSAGENPEQRNRRVQFYRRAGAREVQGVRYFMPGLSGGPPTENVNSTTLANPDRRALDGATIREAIIQIYREVYGRGSDDALLNTFLHEVPERVSLV